MLLLLFACAALHPIYDLHVHALDMEKRAITAKNNYRQQSFWLPLDDIEIIFDTYCSQKKGELKQIFPLTDEREEMKIDTSLSPANADSIISISQRSNSETNTQISNNIPKELLVQSTYLCTSSEDSDMGNGYIRFHVVGTSKKQIHSILFNGSKDFHYPLVAKTMEDDVLYDAFYQQEKLRLSKYQYTNPPITLLDYAPLPYGYQVLSHTDTKIILERKYIKRIENITPKIAVFKRIEHIEIQLQPSISLSQTTTHVFFSDIEGEYIETIDFEDLDLLRLWLTDIMSRHISLFPLSMDSKDQEFFQEEGKDEEGKYIDEVINEADQKQ